MGVFIGSATPSQMGAGPARPSFRDLYVRLYRLTYGGQIRHGDPYRKMHVLRSTVARNLRGEAPAPPIFGPQYAPT